MKKIVSLFLALLILVSLCACKDGDTSSNASQTESGGETTSSDVKKALSLIELGDVKEAYKTLFLSTDSEAKEMLSDFIVVSTEEISYFDEQSPESILRSTKRRYDERGNLVYEDNGSKILEYTYDENNNVLSVKEIFESYTIDLNYTYDDKGREIKREHIQTNSNGRKETYVYETQYDDHDNVVYYKTISDGQFLHETEFTYKYDDQGRMTYKKGDDPFGEEVTYAYDEKGNLVEECMDGRDKIIYTYDSENRLVSEVYESDFDMARYRFEYTFDANGNLIKEYRWENGGNSEKWYEYTYDSENREVKKAYTHKSGKIDEGYVYEFTYNEKGLKIKENRTNRDEDTERKSIVEYTYDDCGNVVKRATTAGSDNRTDVCEYLGFLYFYRPEK